MDALAPAGETRPRLAVMYGHGSLDGMQICDGARDCCDLVWLVGAAERSVRRVRPRLRRFGAGVDAHGVSPLRATEPLREHAPGGLATFYDKGMARGVKPACDLGLPIHAHGEH